MWGGSETWCICLQIPPYQPEYPKSISAKNAFTALQQNPIKQGSIA